ncbi:alpha-D-ribose 1-methylphosphonate 5-triphosphate diphosphatase [Jiella sp. MQZ9-1]|uniref:Alpha-D-ribose 1-methylphosphonate 5-triphosphate diphosphatase n=1 Tax=Jiella flava TaxID=2816857 RepID=A0A939G0S3_9HYPH|nr:alpha-D-ribose 1-methylphosphonate 5-triphosphate diphosphatase [Jiella flava]MBO0664389.1 alpha-D-ribose 1-methylphosphonate 5-triphosphate diphosphatase [Jiella flava]MCD2473024.1 alpha-D-ribose 1-methylphosphonate 5-triphosphate diphosphatase [Jiella flava]
MSELVLSNARIVLSDHEIAGHVVIRDGLIAEVAEGDAEGEDMNGDLLIPGLVELHTDHIESHYMPRPKVYWDMFAAVQAHDAQIAASGITTVFDAVRVGTDEDARLTVDAMDALSRTITDACDNGSTRAEHFVHLRCEVSAPDAVEGFERLSTNPRVRLASLMDHAPGQRQFVNLDAYRTYYQRKKGLSDQDFGAFIERRIAESTQYADPSRQAIAGLARQRNITLASHDDATEAHVHEALEFGIKIAEFPTTMEAAAASRRAGLSVLMGGPNIVRGGSHSGNIAAHDLLTNGNLDILSSDYVPFSMLLAAFSLARQGVIDLPGAIRLVTANPAGAVGLDDRGEIAVGKRADLVRVRSQRDDRPPFVASVYREGRRVV